MNNFTDKFIEEANDLLEKLEDALLTLENNPEDEKQINEVFRVMHSLKGTGAMFGFDKLSSFTHEMENAYDLVRSKKLYAGKELIDLTFNSIDLIKRLLYEPQSEAVLSLKDKYTEKLKEIVSGTTKKNDTEIINGQTQKETKHIKKQKPVNTFFVHFQPDPGILKNGTHPLYLIDEFFEAGTCKVFLRTNQIPALENMVPDNTYVFWDIFIATAKDENFIRDIFIFVEDESVLEIKKIAGFNMLENPEFDKICNELDFDSDINDKKLEILTEKLKTNEVPASEKSGEITGENTINAVNNDQPETKQHPAQEERISFEKEMSQIKKEGLTTIRVSSEKLDKMLNLISELVTVQARLEHFSRQLNNPALINITEDYQKLSRQLRENALDMRLIPIYNMITRFKRLVRDLSKELNKEVNLVTHGTQTELDKSIIEKLYDPIMHIIRNSMDHGIESKEERIKAGKNPVGTVTISTFYSGTNVVIKISDDGAGIPVEKIKEKALSKGLIDENRELTEKEIINFIFQPGFSTSNKISDISGRGVGMDVVKKNIGDLRGEIEVTSKKGKGTTTTIILPLTLSIIDGLLVYIGKSRYIIPLDNIKQIFRVTREEVDNSFNNIIVRENRQIPFVDLVKEFDEKEEENPETYLVILYFEDREMGFIINAISGKYQAVIKPLNRFVQRNEIFSGATVLGDGNIALVMDTLKIINRYINEN
jgi:two-component system chemotaxis sensor kinase CheA